MIWETQEHLHCMDPSCGKLLTREDLSCGLSQFCRDHCHEVDWFHIADDVSGDEDYER